MRSVDCNMLQLFVPIDAGCFSCKYRLHGEEGLYAECRSPQPMEEITVKSYSGFRLHERPVSFKYRGSEFFIEKILDRSVTQSLDRTSRKYCFKVLCHTNEEFEIFFDTKKDRWFLTDR